MQVKFQSAADFKRSLEARLQTLSAKTQEDLQRFRRQVAFDRFLARIFSCPEPPEFFLKGGYAMELRIATARTTRDVDLSYTRRIKDSDQLLRDIIFADLQSFARIDLNDHFSYQIGKAQKDLENTPYGGVRYPISSLIGNKLFVRFHVDIASEFLPDEVEMIQGRDWLHFCGVDAPMIPMISVEQQFAEKLHAYTMPRGNRQNSRVKDLVDMILLLRMREIKPEAMVKSMQRVFGGRSSHPSPQRLEPPPTEWQERFVELAKECGLSDDIGKAFEQVSQFYASFADMQKVTF